MKPRTPLALANWKMSMTVAACLAFIPDAETVLAELLDQVDVVVCPPFTALWPVARALEASRIQLGGQNIAPTNDVARTGEVSAALLADAGCRWAMLGHWEVRRHLGDDDATIGRKLRLALDAGLAPIVLIGEAAGDADPTAAIERQLQTILRGLDAAEVARTALIYEPESARGQSAPIAPEQVAQRCAFIRDRLRAHSGAASAERVRIIYGGSVAPEYAAALLASPDVDGLGASRRARDPATFAAIVRQIARAKSQPPDSHLVYLALGSNLGDRRANLQAAIARLAPQIEIEQVSAVYETEPAYVLDQPRFLNLALRGRTTLAPPALLAALKTIERDLGRTAGTRFGPRLIDLDILLYDDQALASDELTIPHPRMAERPFVLVPLAEIAPNLTPPGWHAPVATLASAVHGNGDVLRRKGDLYDVAS
jgi:2-amino-4-hydroxy-6-hydroxymethyldihydropteridine diphosphokinase